MNVRMPCKELFILCNVRELQYVECLAEIMSLVTKVNFEGCILKGAQAIQSLDVSIV